MKIITTVHLDLLYQWAEAWTNIRDVTPEERTKQPILKKLKQPLYSIRLSSRGAL